jgi:hypothetical protein
MQKTPAGLTPLVKVLFQQIRLRHSRTRLRSYNWIFTGQVFQMSAQ